MYFYDCYFYIIPVCGLRYFIVKLMLQPLLLLWYSVVLPFMFIHLGYTYLGCGSPTNIGSYLWFVALLFPCIVLICTTILFCRDFTTSTDRICSVDFVSLRAASRSSAGCTPWTGRPAALCLHTIVFVPVTVMLDYAFGALPLCLAGLHVLLPWAVLYTFVGTDATIAWSMDYWPCWQLLDTDLSSSLKLIMMSIDLWTSAFNTVEYSFSCDCALAFILRVCREMVSFFLC